MPHFEQLISPSVIRNCIQEFPKLVATSHLHLWTFGDEIVDTVEFLLIGIMTVSAYDLRMLDLLEASCAKGHLQNVHIAVFDWTDLATEPLRPYLPDIGEPTGTPLVAIWNEGNLTAHAWGYPARRLISDRYDLPWDYIMQPYYRFRKQDE